MTNTEITAKTLTDIITTAGLDTKDFDITATLTEVADYNEAADAGEYEGEYVDLQTVIEWLDEHSTHPTYILSGF
jgi:hypothetical protein